MKRTIQITALLAICVSYSASAVELSCYEERGTRKHFCINEKAVTSNGDTRASPVYSGGPNGVTNTGYILVTNCAKNISTLQDRQGVNFSGGLSSSTPALRSLSEWVCDVEKPRKNPKLRQF
jgi:hypothetical protein